MKRKLLAQHEMLPGQIMCKWDGAGRGGRRGRGGKTLTERTKNQIRNTKKVH